MSNTTNQLIEKRQELEKQAEELQLKAAEHRFTVNLDDRRTLKTIMEHLDKGYTWKTQNAAIVVTLYDNLKKQYRESEANEETTSISLRGHELNGLYQALLNVEGNGVESARRFIKMLTNIGEAVTTAMKELGEMNLQITQIHQELSILDQQIDEAQAANNVEQVEPELEVVTDEAQK